MDEVTKSKVMEICKAYNVLFNQFSEDRRAKSDEVDAKTIISYYLFKTAKMKQREVARWLRISRSLVATNIKRFEDMFEFDKEFREMCDSLGIYKI